MDRLRRPKPVTALLAALALAACGGTTPPGPGGLGSTPPPPPAATPAPAPAGSGASGFGIHVDKSLLVDDETGGAVQLRGVNQMAGSGCTGRSPQPAIIYGPTDPGSLTALSLWHADAVRITMNEDCWLGINGVPAATGGAAYRDAIAAYVGLLTSHHYYVIVSMSTNAPGGELAQNLQPMADQDHSPAFWSSVAGTFKGNPAVIMEPYNEPKLSAQNADTQDPWQCWLAGCTATQIASGRGTEQPLRWQTAGMQELVDAIRGAGAGNVITLSGLGMASDLSGIASHLPADPRHQLAATFHNYGQSDRQNGGCGPSCWDSVIAPLAARMPVITDEIGQSNCGTGYVTRYMSWADAHGVSYLPWGWELWGCQKFAYGLLSDWSGKPNAYGQVFFDHFAQRAAQGGG